MKYSNKKVLRLLFWTWIYEVTVTSMRPRFRRFSKTFERFSKMYSLNYHGTIHIVLLKTVH